MKKAILWLCIGGAVGLFLGAGIEGCLFSVFDIAKMEKRNGNQRYADILLTVAAAHKLGYDGAVEKLIMPFGRNMADSLIRADLREELQEARK